jgi:hypothetical protein
MLAMVHMFELPHDERYLKHLRQFIELALYYRDDNYPGNTAGERACPRCEPTPIDDFRGGHVAGWGHRAFVIRRDAAIYQRDLPPTPSVSNGDENMYANRIASYSKGLPHSDLGEVDLNAYNAYLQALNSARWTDFEAIPLGGTAKLSNPQAAYCYALEGADAVETTTPAGVGSAVRPAVIAAARIPVEILQNRIDASLISMETRSLSTARTRTAVRWYDSVSPTEYRAETINMHHLLDDVIKQIRRDPRVDTR